MRPGMLSFFFLLAHTLSLVSKPLASRERRASAGTLSEKESDMILLALSNKPVLGSARSVGTFLC